MAASKPSSTARGYDGHHRALRPIVLARAHHRCEVITPTGARCGAAATDAGHIVARVHGGLNTLDNYRAECAWHNRSEGARIGNARRRSTPAYLERTTPPSVPSFSGGAPQTKTPPVPLSPRDQPTRGFVVT